MKKKVVDGVVYNTETAPCVAAWDNGRRNGDFSRLAESLYRTARGNWFLHGSGGPLTEYRRECGQNQWCGSEDIRPLTPEKAMEWLERHDKVNAVEQYFGDKLKEA